MRNLITGRLSVKNLGGPIKIAETAYGVADYDFYQFMLFLGMMNINLAVINFLPIPVLDGGHMVFLIYEKLRGKPASEKVRIGATYAGLLLIGSLMLFVIFLDVSRWF
jgi:regulator of sigma E protease